MAKSNSNRISSTSGKSECRPNTPKQSFHLNASLNKASSNSEHRRTSRRYKKKKTTNNPGKTVRIPLVKLKEPFRFKDSSRDRK